MIDKEFKAELNEGQLEDYIKFLKSKLADAEAELIIVRRRENKKNKF